MFHLCTLILVLLTIIEAFYVQIDLTDENLSISPKFICIPSSEKLNPPDKHKILWNGTQFGANELKGLSEKLQADVLMPSMSINSSTKHVCYLIVPRSFAERLSSLKKRILRDDGEASVPMENGICPSGHRIDQDKCVPCFPGSYSSGQDAECFLCPKDFYMSEKAANSCWPCPEGKNTVAKGANTEEACINLNGTDHAEIKQGSPWVILYVLISFILFLVWIAIMILLIRYWKWLKEPDVDEGEMTHRRKGSQFKKSLFSWLPKCVRQSIPNDSENIYAEIYEDDGTYEAPIKPEDPPLYVDLEAPPLPPRRKDTERSRDTIYKAPSDKSADQYEIPIRRKTLGDIRRSSEDQYEIPIKSHSHDQYEVPIPRRSDRTYMDVLDEPEDHIYSEIKSEDEINRDETSNESKIESSKSVDSVHFSAESARQIPSRSASFRTDEGRKYSSSSRRYSIEM